MTCRSASSRCHRRHTETLFAIGAGDQVIAVDDQSNYPPEAEAVMTDLSGFEPNVEAIAGYEPDLVVTSGDDELTAQLEALGITVWAGPAATTFDEAYAQIEQLGAVTGHVAEAAELVGQMQTDLEEIAAEHADVARCRSPCTTSSAPTATAPTRRRSSARCTTTVRAAQHRRRGRR